MHPTTQLPPLPSASVRIHLQRAARHPNAAANLSTPPENLTGDRPCHLPRQSGALLLPALTRACARIHLRLVPARPLASFRLPPFLHFQLRPSLLMHQPPAPPHPVQFLPLVRLLRFPLPPLQFQPRVHLPLKFLPLAYFLVSPLLSPLPFQTQAC